jgi:hypothetical protein
MWKNVVESGRPQMIQRRKDALCVLDTNTYSGNVIHIVFHCNDGYENASQYYPRRTLPVLLVVLLQLK